MKGPCWGKGGSSYVLWNVGGFVKFRGYYCVGGGIGWKGGGWLDIENVGSLGNCCCKGWLMGWKGCA
jgi:hypothetical protein